MDRVPSMSIAETGIGSRVLLQFFIWKNSEFTKCCNSKGKKEHRNALCPESVLTEVLSVCSSHTWSKCPRVIPHSLCMDVCLLGWPPLGRHSPIPAVSVCTKQVGVSLLPVRIVRSGQVSLPWAGSFHSCQVF